jgi:hypothetical protein
VRATRKLEELDTLLREQANQVTLLTKPSHADALQKPTHPHSCSPPA